MDAPGLPDRKVQHPVPKIEKPTVWQFALHDHKSEGAAGQHFDLRLGDPDTGHAHSWAMKYWPKPGESRLAVQQPTHTVGYMDFEGRIEKGYGKGDVKLAKRDKTEIVSSSSGHVRFNLYTGKNTEEFLLRKTDDKQWLLRNITTTRENSENLPSSKPPYKNVATDKLKFEDPNTILQAKIDGAHVLYSFKKPGSTPDIFSYRPTERASGVIEHTHKVPGVLEKRTPAALKDTILRGELYAIDRNGKALESHRIGGILNSNVWKSREKQNSEGKLVPVVFDVVRWKGKDVSNVPYSEKKKLLEQAIDNAPWLKLPRTATTESEKKKLFNEIKQGKEPSTKEGVIEWNLNSSTPKKSKFRDDHDVYIRDVFYEKSSRGMAGGFSYSMTPAGKIVGKVGTGFSHSFKKDLAENPDKYKGLKAMVQMTPGHVGRAPSFVGLHLDQDIPEGTKLAGKLNKRWL